MRTRLLDVLDHLRTSLWFVPGLLTLVAALLAIVLIWISRKLGGEALTLMPWLRGVEPEGAWAILSVVAGSIVTVAGVVFSVTVVAVSLASQQYSPRLLRNFMRDRGNQIVLGVFIGTFVYCIIVMRVIPSGASASPTPHLAVTGGILLALVSLGLFIYFIHHVVISMQADYVIAAVGQELDEVIDALYPEPEPAAERGTAPRYRDDDENDSIAPPELLGLEHTPIVSLKTGYLRAIDEAGLVEAARVHDVVIEMRTRPGKFLIAGLELANAYARTSRPIVAQLTADINAVMFVGRTRTAEQDVEFCMHQLVEVALRALSPSLNDPFTAIVCVDRLAAALCNLGRRPAPSRRCVDRDGVVRVIVERASFAGAVNAAFNQIRQFSRKDVAVSLRLLEAIALTIECLRDHPERCKALLRQAEMVFASARREFAEHGDLHDLRERYDELMRTACPIIDISERSITAPESLAR